MTDEATATEATPEAAPEVDLSTIPEGTDPANVVKPVTLASERGIRPQIVFGWIRNGGLTSYKDTKGKNVILRSDLQTWEAEKAQKKADREEKKKAAEAEKAAKAAATPAAEAGAETSSEDDGEEDYS